MWKHRAFKGKDTREKRGSTEEKKIYAIRNKTQKRKNTTKTKVIEKKY